MNAPFQQQDEQEHQQQCLEVLHRIEQWQHSREDVLFLAAEMGLTKQYHTGENYEQKQPHG